MAGKSSASGFRVANTANKDLGGAGSMGERSVCAQVFQVFPMGERSVCPQVFQVFPMGERSVCPQVFSPRFSQVFSGFLRRRPEVLRNLFLTASKVGITKRRRNAATDGMFPSFSKS